MRAAEPRSHPGRAPCLRALSCENVDSCARLRQLGGDATPRALLVRPQGSVRCSSPSTEIWVVKINHTSRHLTHDRSSEEETTGLLSTLDPTRHPALVAFLGARPISTLWPEETLEEHAFRTHKAHLLTERAARIFSRTPAKNHEG